MARATRTAEILAAAKLADLDIAREMEKTKRASATSQALASLIPSLVSSGAGIARDVYGAQRQDKLDQQNYDLRLEALGVKREALAKPAKVDPYAEEKNKRAAEEEARKAAKFEEEQRKARGKVATEEAGALMASPAANPRAVRGIVLDESGKATDAALDRSERGISAAELDAAGEDAGVSGRALLGRLDTAAQEGVDAKRKDEAQAADKAQRLALQREEMARKKAADAQRAAYQDALLEEKRAAAKEKAEGRPLPAEVAEKRALKTSALNLVDKVREAKKKVGTGSVEGRVQKWGSSVIDSPDWAEFKALSETLKRTVGRVIEGGKMAAGDEIAYDSFLNNPTSLDEKEYDRVVDVMEWILTNDLDAFDANLQGFRLAPRPPRQPKPVEGAPAPSTSTTTPDADAAELGFTIDGG